MNFFNTGPVLPTEKDKNFRMMGEERYTDEPSKQSKTKIPWRKVVEKKKKRLRERSRNIKDKYNTKLNPIYTKANESKTQLNEEKAKIGVVITTHGFNGVFVRQALECYIRELPDNYFIVLYINESNDRVVLDLVDRYNNDESFKGKIQVIYIKDQKSNGGLTGTWNQGIDLCFENNCEIIVLSNDDILFDSTINNILWACYKNKDEMKYFGPISNNPGPKKSDVNKCQYGLLPLKQENKIATYKKNICNLNGFFMVFSKKVLIKNKYNSNYYFDPTFPFGGNECEWFERFKKISGNPIIVPETFIYHYKLATWRKNQKKNNKCIYSVNTGNYEGFNIWVDSSKFDLFYFTDNFKLIYLSIEKGLIPFYVDTKGKDAKLIQRTIKTSPLKYLPHNYDLSLYIDGSMSIIDYKKIEHLFKMLEKKYDVIAFTHPERDKVKDEAKVIIKKKLETPENVKKIINEMNENKYMDDKGLSETGVLFRNHSNIKEFSKHWCKCINICRRDQISFDYLINKYKLKFTRGSYREKKLFIKQAITHYSENGRTIK